MGHEWNSREILVIRGNRIGTRRKSRPGRPTRAISCGKGRNLPWRV